MTGTHRGGLALIAWLLAMGQLRGETFRELTTVREARALTTDQARQARPLRLRGVVTALSGFRNSFFVQDATAGISVDRTDKADVQVGDVVEITGTSHAGMFAPVVLASYVRVAGHVPPPLARRVTYGDMFGGREDSQWIEVDGVVHSARITKLFGRDILTLGVELDGGSVNILLQDFAGMDHGGLIDSRIRVRGVCSTEFNQKRQFVGLGLFVPDRRDIDIVQPAEDDPFAAPITAIRNVLQFGQAPHRVKVTGIVTSQIPGHAVYIQDGDDGIRIQSLSKELVEPGRKIEAVGFPAMGEYAPTLKEGWFRAIGYAAPIVPRRVDAKDVINRRSDFERVPYDQQLVQLQGTIAESHIQRGQSVWILRRGDEVFEAYLPSSIAPDGADDVGSALLLTGICTVHADSDRTPVSFGILLRSSKDIIVLKRASWWTAAHGGWVSAILVVLVLLMGAWMAAVRREESLRVLTLTDALSGLYNRRGFFMLAERQWQLALRRKTSILLFYIDVDRFKEINDELGHAEGDRAIQAVAAVLRECFRKTDIIARVGGDEFAIAAIDHQGRSAAAVEQRLAEMVRHSNEKEGRLFQLSLSVGVLTCESSMETLSIEELMAQADALMYQRKRDRKREALDHCVPMAALPA